MRITQAIREFFLRVIKYIRQWLNRSRFVLAIVCLIIGWTSNFIFIESQPYIEQIRIYVNGQKQGYDYAWNFDKADKGVVVKAAAYPANEKLEVDASLEKEKDEAPISSPISLNTIAERIYTLESSQGQNDDKCHRVGGHNGYGFQQGNGKNFCLKSDDEVRELVIEWFEEKLKTHSLKESVCGYNLGFNSEHLQECINQSNSYPYYRDFLTI